MPRVHAEREVEAAWRLTDARGARKVEAET